MSWLSRVRLDGVYKIIAEINFENLNWLGDNKAMRF